MSGDLVGPLGLVLDQKRKKRIQAVNGAKVPCLGSTRFQINYDGQTTNVLALVTTALSNKIVLSWRALQRLKVLPKDFPRAQTTVKAKKAITAEDASEDDTVDLQESMETLKKIYASVFQVGNKLKTMTGPPMKIELKDNIAIKPIHLNTPRRTAYAYQEAAKVELDKLVALGVLEKVEGTSEWISPMSFAP